MLFVGVIVLGFLNKHGLLSKIFQARIFKRIGPICSKGCASISRSLNKIGAWGKISKVIKSVFKKTTSIIKNVTKKISKKPFLKSTKNFLGKIKKSTKIPNFLKKIKFSSVKQKIFGFGKKFVPKLKDTFKKSIGKIKKVKDRISKGRKGKTSDGIDDLGGIEDSSGIKSLKTQFNEQEWTDEGQIDYVEDEEEEEEEEVEDYEEDYEDDDENDEERNYQIEKMKEIKERRREMREKRRKRKKERQLKKMTRQKKNRMKNEEEEEDEDELDNEEVDEDELDNEEVEVDNDNENDIESKQVKGEKINILKK